jgi:cysteine synthase A
VQVAERVAAELENGCFANQFENTANFLAHYRTTGPEIWRQTGGKLSAFVMAAGTGGTIAGVGAYLREQDPGIKVFLIDPPGSALFHKVESGVCYAPQQAERRLQVPLSPSPRATS